MKIIGITGGIGVGKSMASKFLGEFGGYVIDADEISRNCVKKGSIALDNIKDIFGKDVIDSNEELDRKKLADIVFSNPEKLDLLTNIVHKEVYNEMKTIIENYRDKNYNGIVFVDIPLPTIIFRKLFDELWVIDSSLETRIKRIIVRSGYTKEQALARINSQMPQNQYIEIADKVILNNDTINEFKDKLSDLYNTLKESEFD